jgi:hypothetical protein
VTTTLDATLQKTAEKWVRAAAIVPNRKDMTATAKALGFKKVEPWMANLKNKDLHNSALVAVDYETGELVAVVNETFAKKFFKEGEEPLGQHFGLDLPENAGHLRIVGVVGDMRFAGFALRRRPDWHKRLIVLATIQVLWPAFFRFRHLLPMVPRPEISFALVLAYSPILVAALRDKLRYGRIHPVWLFVAPALVLEQSLEVAIFDIPPWRRAGQALYAWLS